MTDPQPALLPELAAGPSLPSNLAAMHQVYGTTPGMECGDCVSCYSIRFNSRRKVYKCNRARQSAGPATDWRTSWPACGLWRRNGQ